jgi:peptidoglycan hydrolase-like protein with peptidoglycan-binding domain
VQWRFRVLTDGWRSTAADDTPIPVWMTLTTPPPPALPPVLPTITPRPLGATMLAATLQAEVAFAAPAVGAEAEAASAAATVERAVLADDILERGDSGAVVRDLQTRLGVLGYAVHVDGAFGPGTEQAVQSLQRDEQVAPTGRVGRTTLLALRLAEASRHDVDITRLFPSVGPGRHLREGGRGLEVETLQRALSRLGHDVVVDGDFGPGTTSALRAFQTGAGVMATGELGPTTLQALDRALDRVGASVVLALPSGYGPLEQLAQELGRLDGRFTTRTLEGRSALAYALAIGGTEVHGRHTTATDFFTRRGGTGNNMLGFAQFNLDYHRSRTSTPERYADFLADILTGQALMPDSAPASNHVAALRHAITSGRVRTGNDFRALLDARGFGGSNWQGIDDGWGRNPGLADALVAFVRAGTSPPRT